MDYVKCTIFIYLSGFIGCFEAQEQLIHSLVGKLKKQKNKKNKMISKSLFPAKK